MIALLASPVARWMAGMAFVLAILASVYAKGRLDGRADVLAQNEASNRKAHSKADNAERDVLACPPGKWNKEAGKCEP